MAVYRTYRGQGSLSPAVEFAGQLLDLFFEFQTAESAQHDMSGKSRLLDKRVYVLLLISDGGEDGSLLGCQFDGERFCGGRRQGKRDLFLDRSFFFLFILLPGRAGTEPGDIFKFAQDVLDVITELGAFFDQAVASAALWGVYIARNCKNLTIHFRG